MSTSTELYNILVEFINQKSDIDLINFIATSKQFSFKYKFFVLLKYLYNNNIQFIVVSSNKCNIHNIYSTIHSNVKQNHHVLYLQTDDLKGVLQKIQHRSNKMDQYTFESNVLCSILPEYLTYNRNVNESLIYLMVDFKLFNLLPLFETIYAFKDVKIHPMSLKFNEKESPDDAIVNFITKRYYGVNCKYYKDDEFDNPTNMFSRLQTVASDLRSICQRKAKHGGSNLFDMMNLLLKIRNTFLPIQKNLIYILITTTSLGTHVSKLILELKKINNT